MTEQDNIEEALTQELGFHAVRDHTLEKRLKDISHEKYLGDDSYLYWSSKNSMFYVGDDYKAHVSGARIEHVVSIPKNVTKVKDVRRIVKALS